MSNKFRLGEKEKQAQIEAGLAKGKWGNLTTHAKLLKFVKGSNVAKKPPGGIEARGPAGLSQEVSLVDPL